MEARTVLNMIEEMDGRSAVALMNMEAANALYACLIQGAKGHNRVAELAAHFDVSPKTVYAWCANRATPPIVVVGFCAEVYEDEGCWRALHPRRSMVWPDHKDGVSHSIATGTPVRGAPASASDQARARAGMGATS